MLVFQEFCVRTKWTILIVNILLTKILHKTEKKYLDENVDYGVVIIYKIPQEYYSLVKWLLVFIFCITYNEFWEIAELALDIVLDAFVLLLSFFLGILVF